MNITWDLVYRLRYDRALSLTFNPRHSYEDEELAQLISKWEQLNKELERLDLRIYEKKHGTT